MQRVTVSIDDPLAQAFDDLARSRGYASRSEAVRDVLREALTAHGRPDETGPCVASLSYVYNHHERAMAARLMELQHDHQDLVLATCHVHLNHDDCLETMMLKGSVMAVNAFADAVRSERGVRNGALNVIRLADRHDHGHHHDRPPSPGLAHG